MTHIAVLGATGRSGSAAISELDLLGIQAHALIRTPTDTDRLPETTGELTVSVVDTSQPDSMRDTLSDATTVINAIRLRGDAVEADAVLNLHATIIEAAGNSAPHIVTVGGAGTLMMPGGERFVNTPGSGFPAPTASRARAHIHLREALEAGDFPGSWAYLIPPPRFDPNGTRHGLYSRLPAGKQECAHTQHWISYADFGIALAHAAIERWEGTSLIADPQSLTSPNERKPS